MKHRVLLVGGAGYIGGYLTDLLVSKGYSVVVYDSLVYETRFLKHVPFVRGDIRDRQLLRKCLSSADSVVWLAALVGDGACALDPFLTASVNEHAVGWLARNYTGRIVFTSTCSVYGASDGVLSEAAATRPLSAYAATKLSSEAHLLSCDAEVTVLRLGTLCGIGDSHSRVRFDLVVNLLSKKAAMGEVITVFGGDQWRPLLHVKDAARAIVFSLEHGAAGVYNLHYENLRIRDIADRILLVVPEASVAYEDLPFEDNRNYQVSSAKFRGLGWSPEASVDEAISEVVRVVGEGRIKCVEDAMYSNERYLKSVGVGLWSKK